MASKTFMIFVLFFSCFSSIFGPNRFFFTYTHMYLILAICLDFSQGIGKSMNYVLFCSNISSWCCCCCWEIYRIFKQNRFMTWHFNFSDTMTIQLWKSPFTIPFFQPTNLRSTWENLSRKNKHRHTV